MEFFTKLSDKEKKGLLAAILVLSIAFFDGLIISPISRNFQRVNQEIKINEKQLIHNIRNVSQKDAITAEYKKCENYAKKSSSDEEESTQIFAEIEKIARQARVYLVNVKPLPVIRVSFYKEYAVDIDVEGAPEAITNFLYQLNASPLLLRAVRVRMELKDKTSDVVKTSILVTRVLI